MTDKPFNPWPFSLRCHDIFVSADRLLICRRLRWHRGCHKNIRRLTWERR